MRWVLSVFFGIVGILSFAFALWKHHTAKVEEEVEHGKMLASAQRIRCAYNISHSIAYNADMIVQHSKRQDATLQELQNLARSVRSQTYMLMTELKSEHSKMTDWKYGVMIPSEELDENVGKLKE